jgi:hemolysin activation/secretion protein
MLVWSLQACLALAWPAAAFGQSPPAEAARAAERIQQEEQERQRQQFLLDQQRRGPPARLEAPSLPEVPVAGVTGCVDIRHIAINAAPHLPDADRSRISGAFTGKCLNISDIEKILGEITRSYIDRGYATARAYVQQQDISAGRLDILVVEGVLEKIMLRDEATGSLFLGNAFPGLDNQPLNLRSLEQGLSQINRLASNNATLAIVPGEKVGGSVVLIDNKQGRRYSLSLLADNMGSTATGRHQFGASFSLDSPLGLNDFVSYTHRQSRSDDSGRSVSDSISYIVPFGYTTWTFGGSGSSYASSFSLPSGLRLKSSGDSAIRFLKMDRAVYQNRDSRLAFSGTLTSKDSRNYLEGELITVSSRKLTVADLDANYSTRAGDGVLSLDLGYSQGLKAFDALSDPDDLSPTAPRAQFRKTRYGASLSLPFKLLGRDARAASQLSGQRAHTPLYSSEQVSAGGIYAVRGFFDQSLIGDDGFVLRNELSLNLPVDLNGQAVLLRPYVGLDYGRASSKAPGNVAGAISGAAVGVAFASGPLDFDLFYATALRQPNGLPKESGQVFITLRVRI